MLSIVAPANTRERADAMENGAMRTFELDVASARREKILNANEERFEVGVSAFSETHDVKLLGLFIMKEVLVCVP